MMDDLRDYRFYADDMLHPSKVAVDYIWEQFSKTYFGKETTDIIKEIDKIILARNHRSLNPDTISHKKFLESQVKFINVLASKNPYLNFNDESEYFKNSLK